MEKKLIYGAIVFLVFVFLAFILYDSLFSPSDSLAYPKEIRNEDNYCEADDACMVVHIGCCQEYSRPNLVAVNKIGKQKISEWKQENCVPCRIKESVSVYDRVLPKVSCQENQCKLG